MLKPKGWHWKNENGNLTIHNISNAAAVSEGTITKGVYHVFANLLYRGVVSPDMEKGALIATQGAKVASEQSSKPPMPPVQIIMGSEKYVSARCYDIVTFTGDVGTFGFRLGNPDTGAAITGYNTDRDIVLLQVVLFT